MSILVEIWPALRLTLLLAAVSTTILMILALPLAWWLARTRHPLRPVVEAVTALPLVLPPTVLGFYLLLMMAPDAPVGGLFLRLTGDTLAFSFSGLVIASCLYSLPFAVQPLQTAFQAVSRGVTEAAATLGARPSDVFLAVVLPLSRGGALTAIILSFAHTMGEFGVVLMVGGNIPGRTRVVSIEVFQAVETLDYTRAHVLSVGLLVFSLVILTLIYRLNRGGPWGLADD